MDFFKRFVADWVYLFSLANFTSIFVSNSTYSSFSLNKSKLKSSACTFLWYLQTAQTFASGKLNFFFFT